MTDIIIKAYDVLEEFKSDALYQKLKHVKKQLEQNHFKDIEAFNLAKANYDLILSEGGTYHPSYKDAVKALSEAKSRLYAHPLIEEYKALEKAFELMLNAFIQSFTKHISDHIQTPNQLGFFTKQGGGCHVY